MTFFNKKEEVLDVKLTPYGRYLLSVGKLRPAYYCFIDDDVVYDVAAIGEAETQNQSHQRIVNETPKLKPIPNVTGVKTKINAMESVDSYIDSTRLEKDSTKLNRLPLSLGTNSYSSQRSATFGVSALEGEFKTSAHYYTGSTNLNSAYIQTETIHVPQVEMNPKYTIEVSTLSYGDEMPVVYEGEISKLFDDFTYFKVIPENPLLYFKEFNSFNHMKNYDIEVFEVIEEDNASTYKPLKFERKNRTIVNDMLIDPAAKDGFEFELGDDYVEYYFDVLVDKEIPDETICKNLGKIENKDIFVDEEINCPEIASERFDIYGTKVSSDDLERCD